MRVAKINDVQINLESIELNGGLKSSIEELLNGGRYFQHVGIIEPIITVSGSVDGDARLARLRAVFEKQGTPVRLSLPITNASTMELYSGEYSCTLYDKSAIERYSFTVKLTASKLASDLAKASTTKNIKNSKLAFLSKTANFIKNTYRTTASTLQIASDTVNESAATLYNISSSVPSLVNELQLFTESFQNLQLAKQTFIQLPDILDNQIKGLVQTFAEIGQTENDQISALQNMLNGNLIQEYDNSCSFLEDRSRASNPIQTNFYCYGIDRLLSKINDKEYKTKESVQESIDYLNNQKEYISQKLYDKDLASELILYINTVILNLKQKAIQLPPIFTAYFDGVSDVSAYYAYYGNLDGLEAWREYNKIPTYGMLINQNVKFY